MTVKGRAMAELDTTAAGGLPPFHPFGQKPA
jgi:hypothetical protein